jgi:multifunctional methyltransferase subunit TRM112
MKLLTHNMLASNMKNVTNRYPLIIRPTTVEEEANEFNPEFTKKILPRIVYDALRGAALSVGFDKLPEAPPPDAENDEQFLQLLHHVLMNVREFH